MHSTNENIPNTGASCSFLIFADEPVLYTKCSGRLPIRLKHCLVVAETAEAWVLRLPSLWPTTHWYCCLASLHWFLPHTVKLENLVSLPLIDLDTRMDYSIPSVSNDIVTVDLGRFQNQVQNTQVSSGARASSSESAENTCRGMAYLTFVAMLLLTCIILLMNPG